MSTTAVPHTMCITNDMGKESPIALGFVGLMYMMSLGLAANATPRIIPAMNHDVRAYEQVYDVR